MKSEFDMIEHCSWVGNNGIEYDKIVADLIAKKGIFVVPTVATCYPKDYVKEKWIRLLGPLEARLQVIHNMFKQGVHIIAGTDDSEFDTLAWEIELLTRANLSHFEAIQAATKLAAEALGIDDQTGSIKSGKRADIIAVEGNPLEDIRSLNQIRLIVKNGQILDSRGIKIEKK